MKKLFLILCLLPSAFCHAQTKSVTKTVPGNDVTESLNIPSGKTFTVKSGGTLDVTGATLVGFANDSNPLPFSLLGGTGGIYLSGTSGMMLNYNFDQDGNIPNAADDSVRLALQPTSIDGQILKVKFAAANVGTPSSLLTLDSIGDLSVTGTVNGTQINTTAVGGWSSNILGNLIRFANGGIGVTLSPGSQTTSVAFSFPVKSAGSYTLMTAQDTFPASQLTGATMTIGGTSLVPGGTASWAGIIGSNIVGKSNGGFGTDVSASSGFPFFTAGVLTFRSLSNGGLGSADLNKTPVYGTNGTLSASGSITVTATSASTGGKLILTAVDGALATILPFEGMGTSRTFKLPIAGTSGTTLIGSSDVGTLPPAALTSSSITLGGTSASLGGSASLDNILSLSGTGLMVRTAANTLTTRSLIAGTGITISNPDGVSGNITIASTASGGTGTVTSVVAGTGLNGGTITTSGTVSINLGYTPTWTSNHTFSMAGTASTSVIKLTGTPATGTGTTAFPLFYINDAAATASTVLNTNGTYFGINLHGSQDFINLLNDGVSKLKIASSGSLTIPANTTWTVTSGKSIGFGSGGMQCDAYQDFTAGDTTITPHDGAAGVVSLKQGSTQHKLRVYGTTTGSKYIEVTHNGTDGAITTSSGTLTLSSNSGGVTLTPVTAPASPASGFTIYVDSADSKLKAKSSGGTVTILANP
jgi:hypothetical protein